MRSITNEANMKSLKRESNDVLNNTTSSNWSTLDKKMLTPSSVRKFPTSSKGTLQLTLALRNKDEDNSRSTTSSDCDMGSGDRKRTKGNGLLKMEAASKVLRKKKKQSEQLKVTHFFSKKN